MLAEYFALASAETGGFFSEQPERLVDAVLLDIDHSPSHWLNPGNSSFYAVDSLKQVAPKIHLGGVFAL